MLEIKRKAKTSLPRTTTLKRAKPGVIAAQVQQRRALNARSSSRCEMEILLEVRNLQDLSDSQMKWERCNKSSGMVVHIYNRPKCGVARDLLAVVVYGCARCHKAFGDSLKVEKRAEVRPPLRYAQMAWKCIVDNSRLGVDVHGAPIAAKDLGPYPEAGVGIYA